MLWTRPQLSNAQLIIIIIIIIIIIANSELLGMCKRRPWPI